MIAVLADRDLAFVLDANRFDHPHQAIGDRPIDLWQVPTAKLLLSTVDGTTLFRELIQPLEQPCQFGGRRVRALRPFQPDDHALAATVNRGEFAINGFRNRDLQRLLYASHPAQKLCLDSNGGDAWQQSVENSACCARTA